MELAYISLGIRRSWTLSKKTKYFLSPRLRDRGLDRVVRFWGICVGLFAEEAVEAASGFVELVFGGL